MKTLTVVDKSIFDPEEFRISFLDNLKNRLHHNQYHSPENFIDSLEEYVEIMTDYAEKRTPNAYNNMHSVSNGYNYQELSKAKAKFPWRLFDEKYKISIPREAEIKRTDIKISALLKIISKYKSREGSRKATLFAREMDLDMEIPLTFSINMSDPYLTELLAPYIKLKEIPLNTVFPIDYYEEQGRDDIEVAELGEILKEYYRFQEICGRPIENIDISIQPQ